jgi:hypothetical protein
VVASAGIVALVECGADDRARAGASTGLTSVGLGASVTVVARRAVGLGWIGADAGCSIANSDVVALVFRGANHRVGADALSGLAGIGVRARTAVVANRTVCLRRIGARAIQWIANSRHVALIERHADDRRRPDASAGLTSVDLRAGIAVAARSAIGLGGVGANTVRWIARPWIMALIEREAGHRIGPDAATGLAGIGLRARVAVGAGRSVLLGRIRASAIGWIARARHVALVARVAHDRVRTGACARLTTIGLRARVAVVAWRVVALGGIRANSVGRIANARVVALIEGAASDRVSPGARA